MSIIQGRCLCGNVVYEITGPLGPVYNCHCSKCRRWHGAAFRTRASIDVSQFKLVAGQDCLSSFNSSDNVTKHFCRVSGSPLHSTYADRPTVIGVALGALEGVESKPEANIFTASKASWYEITDGLPQYESWPGSEAKVRETGIA
jgi:hypothetical protein